MKIGVVTIFPEMVKMASVFGVTGKAIEREIVELKLWNPRDYTHDKHRTVDDRPYGGGPGMVMKYQPLFDAVTEAKNCIGQKSKVVLLSPQGRRIDQKLLVEHAKQPGLVLVAGRYEGVDERFVEHHCDEEWSLGDFVISGGELAALIVIDAITRLIPGVLGDKESAEQDSHMYGLLDCPHYTRPEKIAGEKVPEVLLQGNHAEIERWREKQALGRTWQRRPDMLDLLQMTDRQRRLLEEFKIEENVGCGNE